MMASMKPATRRALLWSAAVAAMAAVFASYMQPHLVVDLANRVWSCF
jgi:hypothetical protein